jgi:hypothetical protein
MAAPLSEEKQAELWRAYKEKPSASYVSNTCAVSRNTAIKYIKLLDFPTRLKRIQEKAVDIAEAEDIDEIVEDIRQITRAKRGVAKALIEEIESGAYEPKVADLDRLARLEAFVKGEPDSRPANKISYEWLEEDVDEED